MAKEFEKYNNWWTRTEIQQYRRESGYFNIKGLKSDITAWNREKPKPIKRQAIQDAVYNNEGYLDWQLFRVALKGLTTEEKLQVLQNRWDHKTNGEVNIKTIGTVIDEIIRIWNYLGALVRGGQLNSKYEVVR